MAHTRSNKFMKCTRLDRVSSRCLENLRSTVSWQTKDHLRRFLGPGPRSRCEDQSFEFAPRNTERLCHKVISLDNVALAAAPPDQSRGSLELFNLTAASIWRSLPCCGSVPPKYQAFPLLCQLSGTRAKSPLPAWRSPYWQAFKAS